MPVARDRRTRAGPGGRARPARSRSASAGTSTLVGHDDAGGRGGAASTCSCWPRPDAAVADVAARVEPVGVDRRRPPGRLARPRRARRRTRGGRRSTRSSPCRTPELGARAARGGAWFAVAGRPARRPRSSPRSAAGRSRSPTTDRAAYHAAACIASNHLVALLGQVERVGATAGVPLEAYLDLVRATVDNVAALGPAAALTGPAARGDGATIDRHLAALARRASARSTRSLAERLPDGWPRASRSTHDRRDRGRARRRARRDGRTVGLVPTMGYLHDGHALADASGRRPSATSRS